MSIAGSNLLRVSVPATLESEEALTDLLSSVLSVPATSYHHFDSGRVTVVAYLEDPSKWTDQRRRELLAGRRRLRQCGLDVPAGALSLKRVQREDWAESWKEHFQPLRIGSTLIVKPTWSDARPEPGQQLVTLDPGLSFGTGHHATTEYCLRQLVAARPRQGRKSFLDLGCGSGILAISAAKLGYAPVRAIDFDPDAVRIARENAEANGVSRGAFEQGDVTKLPLRPQTTFDVVCANLLGNLLIQERRRIAATVTSGGCLILAGILDDEFTAVAKVYEELGCELVTSRHKKEWRSGLFTSPTRERRSRSSAPRP